MEKQFKRVIPDNVNVRGLESGEIKILNIKCSSTKCNDDLHCFTRYLKKAEKKFKKRGVCYNCGQDSIDWDRIHKNDLKDVNYLFDSLRKELLREIFASIKVDPKAVEKANKLDNTKLRSEARKLLNQRIRKYNAFFDGRQTPFGGDNIINYAQHATATCCRKCLEVWYGIPKERELTEIQLDFFIEIIMQFIESKYSLLFHK